MASFNRCLRNYKEHETSATAAPKAKRAQNSTTSDAATKEGTREGGAEPMEVEIPDALAGALHKSSRGRKTQKQKLKLAKKTRLESGHEKLTDLRLANLRRRISAEKYRNFWHGTWYDNYRGNRFIIWYLVIWCRACFCHVKTNNLSTHCYGTLKQLTKEAPLKHVGDIKRYCSGVGQIDTMVDVIDKWKIKHSP